MTKEKLKVKIIELFSEAKNEYLWGGDEDIDGYLHHGDVDFQDLENKIFKLIDKL